MVDVDEADVPEGHEEVADVEADVPEGHEEVADVEADVPEGHEEEADVPEGHEEVAKVAKTRTSTYDNALKRLYKSCKGSSGLMNKL